MDNRVIGGLKSSSYHMYVCETEKQWVPWGDDLAEKDSYQQNLVVELV